MHGDKKRSMIRLAACVAELRQRMVSHRLKLNDDKTEVIGKRFSSKHNMNKLGDLQ